MVKTQSRQATSDIMDTGKKTEAAPPVTWKRSTTFLPGGGSILHALAIIRHLSEADESRGVTAIAKDLRISPSSCFNILKTLVSQDVIEFHPLTKTYTIGYGLLDTVRKSLGRSRILTLAAPGMRQLADKYSTAVGLWQINQTGRPLLIWLAENEASIRIHLMIGQRLPPLAGAVGRCVAAHRRPPPGEFSRMYAKLRLHQDLTPEAYMKEIEKAKQRGFAVDSDCYMRGVTSVAAPILDAADEVTHCLSATMFTGQHDKGDIPVIGEELRALANRMPVFTRGDLRPGRGKTAPG
jgi:DNA-binding IclR family transcriptional regulator